MDQSDSAKQEFRNLWRVRRTVFQMLNDRQYAVSKADLEQTFEAFQQRYGGYNGKQLSEELRIMTAKTDDPQNAIIVFWADEEKIGVKPIKDFVLIMEDKQILHSLLILKKGITPFAKRILQEMSAPADPSKPRKIIELFEENELLINITHHQFVPKHIVLSTDEKKKLLDKYKLKETQLPRIQQIDPVARYFGLMKSQVVKIVRTSETAGRYITYRLCV